MKQSYLRQSDVVVGGPGGKCRGRQKPSVSVFFHETFNAVLGLQEHFVAWVGHFFTNSFAGS